MKQKKRVAARNKEILQRHNKVSNHDQRRQKSTVNAMLEGVFFFRD